MGGRTSGRRSRRQEGEGVVMVWKPKLVFRYGLHKKKLEEIIHRCERVHSHSIVSFYVTRELL